MIRKMVDYELGIACSDPSRAEADRRDQGMRSGTLESIDVDSFLKRVLRADGVGAEDSWAVRFHFDRRVDEILDLPDQCDSRSVVVYLDSVDPSFILGRGRAAIEKESVVFRVPADTAADLIHELLDSQL